MKKETVMDRILDIDVVLSSKEDKNKETVELYLRALYELKKIELEMKADYYATKEEEAKAHTETEKALGEMLEWAQGYLKVLLSEYEEMLKQQRAEHGHLHFQSEMEGVTGIDPELTAIAKKHQQGSAEEKVRINEAIEGFLHYLEEHTTQEEHPKTD